MGLDIRIIKTDERSLWYMVVVVVKIWRQIWIRVRALSLLYLTFSEWVSRLAWLLALSFSPVDGVAVFLRLSGWSPSASLLGRFQGVDLGPLPVRLGLSSSLPLWMVSVSCEVLSAKAAIYGISASCS
ncbi:hypothetical protein F2Q68_00037897 [Brassica cretica]|uniref:Uncharacterized protein n=1 Tax=Brassica cretica TaxID=69181 RepID=A0A8S9H9C7_BRACR|nr:hypothetical protein F2Q68_00037897 [Brassica cretica]